MSVELSPEVYAEIATDLLKTRAPSRTSKNLGYDIKLILQVAEQENQPRSRYEEHNGGEGRADILVYRIARKKAWQVWNNDDPAIAKGRADYEAGTHEMATGRDGDWLLLYSIPRKKVDPRIDYFLPESAL